MNAESYKHCSGRVTASLELGTERDNITNLALEKNIVLGECLSYTNIEQAKAVLCSYVCDLIHFCKIRGCSMQQ